MSAVTEPVMLDRTGNGIVRQLREIKDILKQKKTTGLVYGFHIDGGESNPASKVTYIADAVGMIPAMMNTHTGLFYWGSWKDAFFMPRPCMLKYDGTVDYYLDPNNYGLREDGETPSDVADPTYGGNAMMEWGQDDKIIWYKIVPDENDATSCSVYIADHQEDEDFVCWPFINSQGNQVAHFYTPIYNGTLVNGVLRSISGRTWSTYGCIKKTATEERTAARHNNDELAIWDTEVYCDIVLINLLLTLMGKSTDGQSVYGQGLHTSGTENTNKNFVTGVHNTKGMFYGTNSGTATTYANAVKVFGMENWWGFVWRRFGGLVNVNGTEKFKLTRGTLDGTTADDYVISETAADYDGYLTGGNLPSESGTYINQMAFADNAYTAIAASGTASTHYCDGLWTNNEQVSYAYRGGGSASGARCGPWYLGLSNVASRVYWDVGAAPSCKPLS